MVHRSIDLKVVICWISTSGYLAACWRALALRPGIDLKLIVFPTIGTSNAPFRADLTAGLPIELLDEKYRDDTEHVAARVIAHQPEIVVVPGWAIGAFNGLSSHPGLRAAKFVMAMDTPRKNTWKQKLARLKLRKLLARMDRVIVAGERSWQYARQLGFDESQIRRGVYGFDAQSISAVADRRAVRTDGWPRQFLFMGRYVPAKGIDILLAAFAKYRAEVERPWGLTCCGTGPLADLISMAPGVIDRGFVQPPDQGAVFAEHGAFVIASLYEPWGVAIAEGMSAGLPAICTESCGASVELLRDYWNGISVASGNVESLARAFRWMHDHIAELPAMGQRAKDAAGAFSAEMWAIRWETMFKELYANSDGM
jgi:glycosyltransferase involved in cell wall biosynthesis